MIFWNAEKYEIWTVLNIEKTMNTKAISELKFVSRMNILLETDPLVLKHTVYNGNVWHKQTNTKVLSFCLFI